MGLVSIITPAYNRRRLLNNCYASLLAQTDYGFEWIIVDDGSTDNTSETVKEFDTDRFPVVYVRKENGGKHTAMNAAHPYINGDYVLVLDSDDTLVKTAVEQVKSAWEKYADDEKIGVVTFLKGASVAEPNCIADDEGIPVDIMRYKRRILHTNDCCEVIRSKLFKEYPFPELEGERFISECALWNRVSFTHKCVYVNSVIYLCEYLEGGLTKSGRKLRITNPLGGMFICDIRMDRKNYFKERIKYGLLYTCYGFFAKQKPRQMAKKCRAKGLMWLCLPFGWALYRYWKEKYM